MRVFLRAMASGLRLEAPRLDHIAYLNITHLGDVKTTVPGVRFSDQRP